MRPDSFRRGRLHDSGSRSVPLRRLVLATALAGALTASAAVTASATAVVAPTAAHVVVAAAPTLSADTRFGPHVLVFDPSMPTSEIQAAADAVYAAQVNDEMGTTRWSLLFRPGTYGTASEPLQVKVGYYTEVAGLGAAPGDVVVNGKIEVYNRCLGDGGTSNCIALDNFWRTLSNLTIRINAAGQDGCRASANFWAVSQAVSMRRVAVTGGNLSLMDYCTAGPQYASGGFTADSKLPFVISGSQQQWLTRNSQVDGWSNGVWNQVFSGVLGAPTEQGFPNPPYTTLDTTPLSREKPWLFVDGAGAYRVRVPDAASGTRGTTWADGVTPGRSRPLSDFYVARPGDSAQAINSQLARGKDLLLTPGVYDVDRSIEVKRPGTVVLCMGHATLTAIGGAVPLEVWDRAGTVVAGVTVDAGTVESPALLRVGAKGGSPSARSTASDPLTLSDVYFRVGGPHVGKARVSLEVDSDHVLVDHTWVVARRPRRRGVHRPQRGRTRSAGRPTPRATAWSSTATTSPPPGCSSSTSSSTTRCGTASGGRSCSTRTSFPTTRRRRPSGPSPTAPSGTPGTRSATT